MNIHLDTILIYLSTLLQKQTKGKETNLVGFILVVKFFFIFVCNLKAMFCREIIISTKY